MKKIKKIEKKKRAVNQHGAYLLEYTKEDLGNKINEIIEQLNKRPVPVSRYKHGLDKEGNYTNKKKNENK